MLYEEDPNKCKRKSMGIVLKRRDNAPIVKDVYGGVIDILMKKQNIEESIQFVQMKLQEIIDKKIPIEKLIISKSLRSFYKNPQQVAHNVLATRMGYVILVTNLRPEIEFRMYIFTRTKRKIYRVIRLSTLIISRKTVSRLITDSTLQTR